MTTSVIAVALLVVFFLGTCVGYLCGLDVADRRERARRRW